MPSHAEKNQTEIKNYYRIIDPEERLSENEKAEEERRVLANMPACFPEALRYVMKPSDLRKRLWPLNQRCLSQRSVATEMERLKVFLRKTWLHYALLCIFLHGFRLRS